MKRHRKRGPLVVVTDESVFREAAARVEKARYGIKPYLANYHVQEINTMEDILWGYLGVNGSPDLRRDKPHWILSSTYIRNRTGMLQQVLGVGWGATTRTALPQAILRGRHRKPYLLIGSRLDELDQEIGEQEPFCTLRCGGEVWVRGGVQVPGYAIKTPERITLTKIMRIRNQEVRRVVLECAGHDNMIESARRAGQILYEDSDQYGTLYVMNMGLELDGDGLAPIFTSTAHEIHHSWNDRTSTQIHWSEGRMEMEGWLSWFQENAALLLVHNRAHLAGQLLSFVRVENPPDLTGETRQYFLSVPPWMKTAAEAVAWTYDIPETNYAELVRT